MASVSAAAVASTAGAVKDLRCAPTAPRRVANDTRHVLDCVLVPAIMRGLGAAAPIYESNPTTLFPVTHCPNNGGNLT